MIVIFYLMTNGEPAHREFKDNELVYALKRMEALRAEGMRHVVMSSEPAEMVGKVGAASVEDGKTPDGVKYEWDKSARIGKVRDPDGPVYNDGERVR